MTQLVQSLCHTKILSGLTVFYRKMERMSIKIDKKGREKKREIFRVRKKEEEIS